MVDPNTYFPAWVIDLIDNPPETEKPTASPKVIVDTEQLDGCIVYKPDWPARARRGHWVRAKLAD